MFYPSTLTLYHAGRDANNSNAPLGVTMAATKGARPIKLGRVAIVELSQPVLCRRWNRFPNPCDFSQPTGSEKGSKKN